jgi:hypothetical protein
MRYKPSRVGPPVQLYRRSTAGRLPARPLQRLVNRPRRRLCLNSRNDDSLVTELRDEFEHATKGFDVSPERCNPTVFKVRTSFETRDVSLIDLGLLCDIDLGLADGVTQGSQCKVNASGRTKAATEHSDGLDLGFGATLS